MKREHLRTWYMLMATLIILAIIGLAYLVIFKPGPTGRWQVEIAGMVFSGTSVALGFAVIMFLILRQLLPGLRQAIYDFSHTVSKMIIKFIRLFVR